MAENFEDYKNVWVFAEARDGKLMNVALELLGEGSRLAHDIGGDEKLCAVLIGDDVKGLEKDCFEAGADMIYEIENPLLKDYTTDAFTKVMTEEMHLFSRLIMIM